MAEYKSTYTGAEIDDGIAKANSALQTVPDATQNNAGLMTAGDKVKLDGVETGANKYALPVAASDTLGGVKVGSGLSVASDGTLSATGGGSADSVAWENVTGKPSEYPPETHAHAQADITGLETALSGKADASHTHAQHEIVGLETAIAGKADAAHAHSYSEITGAPTFSYDADTQTLAITV